MKKNYEFISITKSWLCPLVSLHVHRTECPYLPCPGDRDFYPVTLADNSPTRTTLIVVIVLLALILLVVILLICRYRHVILRKKRDDTISFIDVGQRDPTSPIYSKDVYASYMDNRIDDELNDINYSPHNTPIPFGNKVDEEYLIEKNRKKKKKNFENESLRESIKIGNGYKAMEGPIETVSTYENKAFEHIAIDEGIDSNAYNKKSRQKKKAFVSNSSSLSGYGDEEIIIPSTIERTSRVKTPSSTDHDRYGSADVSSKGKDRTSLNENLIDIDIQDSDGTQPVKEKNVSESVARRKKRNLPRVLPGPDGHWSDSPLPPVDTVTPNTTQKSNNPRRTSSKRSLPDIPTAADIDTSKGRHRPGEIHQRPDLVLVQSNGSNSEGRHSEAVPTVSTTVTDQQHLPHIRMPKAAVRRLPEQNEILISPQSILKQEEVPKASVSMAPSKNRKLPDPAEIQRKMSSASSIEQRPTLSVSRQSSQSRPIENPTNPSSLLPNSEIGLPPQHAAPIKPSVSRSSSKMSNTGSVSRRSSQNRKLPNLSRRPSTESTLSRTPSQIQRLAGGDSQRPKRRMSRDEAKVKFQQFAEQINEEISGSLVWKQLSYWTSFPCVIGCWFYINYYCLVYMIQWCFVWRHAKRLDIENNAKNRYMYICNTYGILTKTIKVLKKVFQFHHMRPILCIAKQSLCK